MALDDLFAAEDLGPLARRTPEDWDRALRGALALRGRDPTLVLLSRMVRHAVNEPSDSPTRILVNRWQWILSQAWWKSLVHGAVKIRRSHAPDSDFYAAAARDPVFRRDFGRTFGWSGDLKAALHKNSHAAPLVAGAVFYSIEYCERIVAIGSLTRIDDGNSKAELSIGFPFERPPGVAYKAMLMMLHLVFWVFGLNKVYAYVYEDNQWALDNSLRLGLRREGFLQDHFVVDNSFLSVHAFGLTRAQALEDEHLVKVVKRRINQDWRRLALLATSRTPDW